MKRKVRSLVALLACVFAVAAAAIAIPASAAPVTEYQIYPTPQSIKYGDSEQTLRSTASVVVEKDIDEYTVARLGETLDLKGMTANYVDEIPAAPGTTSLLVGVKGSGGAVDKYVEQLVSEGKLSYDEGIFQKIDAYLLVSLPAADGADQIIVLGKDTDAAFYGLTTLYQIFQQLNGAKLSAFTCEDYADVATRGFIEGYYGNPWSNEDRAALMTWGGYYKLNGYFYAPKNDPKHNSNWRELYTKEELETLIEPLAEAGNASKCRYLYALHPFMHNPITSANYDETLPILQEKFEQVIDHGVRQIAILADDATDQGEALYKKLLFDMNDWIHEMQAKKDANGDLLYPGLKDTIVFIPVHYGIDNPPRGEAWYAELPDNIEVGNTGGRVWGKVDNDFVTDFKANSGKSPFMWINWPCSDNDKDALHMGGHNNFLGSDVQPGDVSGVVLNPMQQSEPSKQGIFMNADFSWNLWTSTTHADQVWEDSFSYIDHNSPIDNKGSNALRELSRHMLRMYGGGTTWINNESSAIQEELTAFRSALTAGTVTADQCDEMIEIFEEIQQYAVDYRNNAGTAEMLEQMDPWISTWDDLTAAAIAELEAVKADLSGDTSTLLSKYSEASTLLDNADNHSLWYVDHYEYARVGKAYLYPTVTALNDYVAERAQLVSNPDAMIWKFITNREDTPNGSTDTLFDGDTTTGVSYQTPNQLTAGTYFGYEQSKPFDLTRFTVTYSSANPSDTLRTGKLQVLREVNGEKVWQDVAGTEIENNRDIVRDFTGLDEKDVYGVRLIATADNTGNCWLTLREIEINKVDGGEVEEPTVYTGTVSYEGMVIAANAAQNSSDNNVETETHYRKSAEGSDRDTIPAGATLIVTFTDGGVNANKLTFAQGTSSAGDVIDSGVIEYQVAGSSDWTKAGDVTSAKEQEFALDEAQQIQAVRVVNGADKSVWWRVADLNASLDTSAEAPAQATISTNISQYGSNAIANAADGNDETKFYSNRATQANDYVMLAFGESKYIDTVRMLQGSSDCITAADLYYTTDDTPTQNGNWEKCGTLGSAAEQEVSIRRVQATGIKFVVTQANGDKWFQLFELQAYEKFSYTKDNVWANFDLSAADVSARVGGGNAAGAGNVTLNNNDIVAIDLGSVRRDVTASVAEDSTNAATLVYSQNGLEWNEFADVSSTVDRARFVGYKASAPNQQTALSDLSATYLDSLDPTVEKSDLTLPATYDVSNIFDGDPTTTAKTSSGPTEAGKAIVFDLGQERTINTIEYMVPDSTYDFIRNAVIEVADTPDAENWTKVLDINSDDIVEDNAETAKLTAANATWMASSLEFPNVKYVSSAEQNDLADLNATGRYLRIRFTGAYTNRWVEIGELRINGGEYVSTYAGGDFVSTVTEQEGMTPDLMIDDNLSTAWAPQAESTGTMTYHVSEPLTADGTAYEGVRIISRGNPTGATVKADVYTDTTFTETTEVTLGTLDQVSQEFRFGDPLSLTRAVAQYTAVKDIKIEWTGETVPQIAEIYLLDTVKSADVAALSELIAEAKKADTSTWTTDSAAALADAIAAAEKGVARADYLTADAVSTLASALENAMNGGVTKYTGNHTGNLQALVDGALTDGTGYTAQSWQAYQAALADAKAALADAKNLSQADGKALEDALAAAQEALAYDSTAADRADQAVADVEAVYTEDKDGNYTTDSWNALTEAEQAIKGLLAEGATPAEFTKATQDLHDAVNGLVDVTALLAERKDFEDTDGTLYTDDSYAAYKNAYDDSTKLLASGSADEVAAAVTALQNAEAGLELKTDEPGVDLGEVIADAKGLNPDDYTTSSWAVLQAAIDAAEAAHDPAQDEELAKAITDAKTALVNVVALKNAIADAEALDTTGKTAESVAALKAAIADARALLADGTQGEVNAAVATIDAAVKALVTEGSQTPTPGPDHGSQGGQSGNQGGNNTSQPGDQISKPAADAKIPATNDNSLPAATVAVVAVILVAAGVFFYIRSRKG